MVNNIFRFLIFFAFAISSSVSLATAKTVEIPTGDRLTMSANLYLSGKKPARGTIVLAHQAGWSRGEYIETGPWLSKLGFHVLALDQRSGGPVNGVPNSLATKAQKLGLSNAYLDALVDVRAGIDYAFERWNQKVILVGSSYSASLSLILAGEGNPHLKAVAAFSPGEYFPDKSLLSRSLKKILIPTFITASKKEMTSRSALWRQLRNKNKQLFTPKAPGHHGSRCLWTQKAGFEDYRTAFTDFLSQF